MINRTKIQDSIYDILDEDPTKIQEYIDTETQKTPKQKEKEKEKRNSISNIADVNLQENIDSQEDNPYNKLVIHTEKDNLVHNYFHHFDMYWDAGDCLSSVTLKLPKTDKNNTKYWITYTGDITVYLGNEINTEMHKSKPESNAETYFTLSTMKPIFKGEIGQIKEYNKELEIHIDSIGKRFKQKIPEEFRQSFINNQNVRDVFVAICEFLGVKYICPPGALPPQDNETENTIPQGDGTENNVENKKAQEQQLAIDVSTKITDAINNSSSNNANNQNNNTQNQLNESTQQNDVQNGYSDISFDANGAIVHNSVTVETSPDMEDTLLVLENHPLDKYLQDTTFVSTDVKRFLNGEMFETIHNSVMNYGSITIQPASSATSEMSTMSDTMGTDTTTDENGGSDNNDNSGSQKGGKSPKQYGHKDGYVKNVYGTTKSGSKYLTKDAINKMSPAEANKKYLYGQQHNIYTRSTMEKLWYRSNGMWLF